MSLKNKKFSPVVNRIALNPEQAVLACSCWFNGTLMIRFDTSRTTHLGHPVICTGTEEGWAKGGTPLCENTFDPNTGHRRTDSTASS